MRKLMTHSSSQPRSFSLSRRLIVSLVVSIGLVLAVVAALSVRLTGESVDHLQDSHLEKNAEVLLAFLYYEFSEEHESEDEDDDSDDEDDEEDDNDSDSEDESVLEELGEIVARITATQGLAVNYRISLDGVTVFTASEFRRFPDCAEGFSHVQFKGSSTAAHSVDNTQTVPWRCFRRTEMVAVGAGQPSDNVAIQPVPLSVEFFDPIVQRQKTSRALIARAFWPLLLLPLIVAVLTWWFVKRGLVSVTKLSHEVQQRSVKRLDRIPEEAQPVELAPVVSSVNALLDGLERGIEKEKRFTDDAAHELRTPLTSISMMSQLIRRDNRNATITEYLNSLDASIDSGTSLVDQLLALARIQGHQGFDTERLDLPAVVHAQLGLLSQSLHEKSLSVSVKVDVATASDGKTVTINANSGTLALLVGNLLSNAIKFNRQEGGVYITITPSSLIIEDDGPGVAPADTERVFDRFFRGSGTAADAAGSGIGLALARRVADAHGFDLSIVSPARGTGAAFKLGFDVVSP